MDASKDEIIKYIKDPRGVTMFSKSFCPYCKDAKKRINGFLGQYDPKKPDKERPYKVIEIDLGMQLYPRATFPFDSNLLANSSLFFRGRRTGHAKFAKHGQICGRA